MARCLRVQYPGAIYHVTLRGNNRRILFRDDKDRQRFLERLSDYVDEFQVRLYLFCLMSNHVHFVLETPQANLSAFMQKLETAYTVYFNLRHGETGHVLDGRYAAKMVEGDDYLLKLSRYVHLNPVHVGSFKDAPLPARIRLLREYRWSSYRSYAGFEKVLDYVDYGPLWGILDGRKSRRTRAYQCYVEEGVAESDEEFQKIAKESPLTIGSHMFRLWIKRQHDELLEKHKRQEDVSFRRKGARLSATVVVEVVCTRLGVPKAALQERRREGWLRPVVSRMLSKYTGLTQRQIAETMGIKSGVAVSLQQTRLKEQMAMNRSLAKTVSAVETELQSLIRDQVSPRGVNL